MHSTPIISRSISPTQIRRSVPRMLIVLAFCCGLMNGRLAICQTPDLLPDLSVQEYAALERVSESSVAGTISFLASDELAGRGTPSKELQIASAYVASRLRAAGAEGLGPDGSFFIESSLDTVQTPKFGLRFNPPIDAMRGSLIEGSSDGDPYVYAGMITRLSASDELPGGFSGPVVIPMESLNVEVSMLFQLRRQVRRLAASGATAVLVEAPVEVDGIAHPLWQLAEQMQDDSRVASPRSRFELPVAVVEPGKLDTKQSLELRIEPTMEAKTIVRNVAGVLRGSDPELAQQALLFSAHLDHLGDTAPGVDRIYNGADDDASGVSAVLTLADAYGAMAPKAKRSLIFVTFWGEESGLLGSKEFVKASPWPLEQIVANINIEMIGRPEEGAINKCWMTGWDQSDLGSLVAGGSRRLGVETFEHPSYSSRLYRASDNFSFVQQGVVAHSFSAGSLHADYHQPSDEWQKLNLPHMTQVIRGLYAGTLPLAQGDRTPQVAGADSR